MLSDSYRKGESAREILNDKQHIAEQKARYKAYETVVDEVIIEHGETAATYGLEDYDDEYDDTYDMNQVGANDLDGDSLLNRRWSRLVYVLFAHIWLYILLSSWWEGNI